MLINGSSEEELAAERSSFRSRTYTRAGTLVRFALNSRSAFFDEVGRRIFPAEYLIAPFRATPEFSTINRVSVFFYYQTFSSARCIRAPRSSINRFNFEYLICLIKSQKEAYRDFWRINKQQDFILYITGTKLTDRLTFL